MPVQVADAASCQLAHMFLGRRYLGDPDAAPGFLERVVTPLAGGFGWLGQLVRVVGWL